MAGKASLFFANNIPFYAIQSRFYLNFLSYLPETNNIEIIENNFQAFEVLIVI